MLKAVLFDLDGTLLDTGKGVVKSVEYTIKKMGFRSLTQEELESFVGPSYSVKPKSIDFTGFDDFYLPQNKSRE